MYSEIISTEEAFNNNEFIYFIEFTNQLCFISIPKIPFELKNIKHNFPIVQIRKSFIEKYDKDLKTALKIYYKNNFNREVRI